MISFFESLTLIPDDEVSTLNFRFQLSFNPCFRLIVTQLHNIFVIYLGSADHVQDCLLQENKWRRASNHAPEHAASQDARQSVEKYVFAAREGKLTQISGNRRPRRRHIRVADLAWQRYGEGALLLCRASGHRHYTRLYQEDAQNASTRDRASETVQGGLLCTKES